MNVQKYQRFNVQSNSNWQKKKKKLTKQKNKKLKLRGHKCSKSSKIGSYGKEIIFSFNVMYNIIS